MIHLKLLGFFWLDLPVCLSVMPRTHGANKSILFAQIVDPYKVNLDEFAQIKDVLFAHEYKAFDCLCVQQTDRLDRQVFLVVNEKLLKELFKKN